MKESTVTVFGGTGFLGRRVIRRLREHGFSVRIASRHPDRCREPGIDGPQLESLKADIHDERSVAEAVAGAYGVVNAVSLTLSAAMTHFIPCTLSPPNASQPKP